MLNFYTEKSLFDDKKSIMNDYMNNIITLKNAMDSISNLYDSVLSEFFKNISKNVCIVAIGGYGRKEMYPFSDCDILIIVKNKNKNNYDCISDIIKNIWDIKLKLKHSVRTISEAYEYSKEDQKFFTALLDARVVFGNANYLQVLDNSLKKKPSFEFNDFYSLKKEEQRIRELKDFSSIEPDVKNSIGGLREVQIIAWLNKFDEIMKNSNEKSIITYLFTNSEIEDIKNIFMILADIRFKLHCFANKPQDKLTLYWQEKFIENNKDIDNNLSLNKKLQIFMQPVYQIFAKNTVLNKRLMSVYFEYINNWNISNDFYIHNKTLYVRESETFKQHAENILNSVITYAKNPSLSGISASLWRVLEEMVKYFSVYDYNNKIVAKLFLDVFKQKRLIYTQLNILSQIGFLDIYIPDFSRIRGLMQFDMYHIHTVDIHTMMLIKNIRKVHHGYDFDSDFYQAIYHELPDVYLLYLAGFFHDIGKGSGFDHSIYGSNLILKFAQTHNVKKDDGLLLSWLVKEHLTLSNVIKQQDIYDKEVIEYLVKNIGNKTRLNYLLILTICDIEATNPNLWNKWKDSLFKTLYTNIVNKMNNKDISVVKTKDNLLNSYNIQMKEKIAVIWKSFPENYFINLSQNIISWHSNKIYKNTINNIQKKTGFLIFCRINIKTNFLEIMLFGESSPLILANISYYFYKMDLTILESRVYKINDVDFINHFVISLPNIKKSKIQKLEESIIEKMNNLYTISDLPEVSIISFNLNKFKTINKILIKNITKKYSELHVISLNKPGMLAGIFRILAIENIWVFYAKILTVANQAEDLFYISNELHNDVSDKQKSNVLEKLKEEFV